MYHETNEVADRLVGRAVNSFNIFMFLYYKILRTFFLLKSDLFSFK